MGAALNDLAYAVNDTIKDPANFKALNVLIQEMINNAVSQALNNTFGTEGASPLNVLIGNGNTEIKNLVTAFQTAMKSGGVPVVRKIQRGTSSLSTSSDSKNSVNITLSGFSNVNKMIVLLDGAGGYRYYSKEDSEYSVSNAKLPYVSALTVSKLTIEQYNYSRYGYTTYFSYQVIEFW